MNKDKVLILCMLLATFIYACTPKVTEPAKVEEPKEVVRETVDENLSPCKKWVNSPDRENARTAHVLYRDAMKTNDWATAFEYWQTAYKLAPAADGKRDFHYTDGIKIYKHFLSEAKDEAKKNEYLDKIFALYDEATNCYADNASLYKGLKAFDFYYVYPERSTPEKTYNLFKEVIDADGEKTAAHIVNPFTALMIERLLDEKIPMAEAQKYTQSIFDIIAYHVKEYKQKRNPRWKSEGWDIVEGYAPLRLEQLEGLEGFYDCSYYKNKYYSEYEAAPDDCDAIGAVYGRLKWGGCLAEDPNIVTLNGAWNSKCRKDDPVGKPSLIGESNDFLRNGNYLKAIEGYEKAIGESEDAEKKGIYALTIAKVYYAHLKKFSPARKYAREALKYRPNWGDPLILIGKLYASSGPLCGPGTGWDSQIVTWPAIDKWYQAKRVDPSVATEANRLINRYSQYMPSVGDIFQRSLKEGDPIKIGCWIQENTTIRAAK